jgi:hypothetical protein
LDNQNLFVIFVLLKFFDGIITLHRSVSPQSYTP